MLWWVLPKMGLQHLRVCSFACWASSTSVLVPGMAPSCPYLLQKQELAGLCTSVAYDKRENWLDWYRKNWRAKVHCLSFGLKVTLKIRPGILKLFLVSFQNNILAMFLQMCSSWCESWQYLVQADLC